MESSVASRKASSCDDAIHIFRQDLKEFLLLDVHRLGQARADGRHGQIIEFENEGESRAVQNDLQIALGADQD